MSVSQIKSIINFDINKAVSDYSKFLKDLSAEDVLENLMTNYVTSYEKIIDISPEDLSDDALIGYLQDYSLNMVKLWDKLKAIHRDNYYEFNLDNPFKDELMKSDSDVAEMIFGK